MKRNSNKAKTTNKETNKVSSHPRFQNPNRSSHWMYSVKKVFLKSLQIL